MENRLRLNKKKTYKISDEVIIGEYRDRLDTKQKLIPKFEPDVVIASKYNIRISSKYKTKNQIWVKSENKELLDFIKKYNFNNTRSISDNNNLSITRLKKIILEEFYGVKNGK